MGTVDDSSAFVCALARLKTQNKRVSVSRVNFFMIGLVIFLVRQSFNISFGITIEKSNLNVSKYLKSPNIPCRESFPK